MRISDWSSDVCSSDLAIAGRGGTRARGILVILFEHLRKRDIFEQANADREQHIDEECGEATISLGCNRMIRIALAARSEERRVGKECISTCSSRVSPDT